MQKRSRRKQDLVIPAQGGYLFMLSLQNVALERLELGLVDDVELVDALRVDVAVERRTEPDHQQQQRQRGDKIVHGTKVAQSFQRKKVTQPK